MKGITSIKDLMKCPECFIEGHFEIRVNTKNVCAECENCGFIVTDRVPYPKHRTDHENFQYTFRVGDVRPIAAHEDDTVTCSQEEYEQDN